MARAALVAEVSRDSAGDLGLSPHTTAIHGVILSEAKNLSVFLAGDSAPAPIFSTSLAVL
jgi:hypothetical protein